MTARYLKITLGTQTDILTYNVIPYLYPASRFFLYLSRKPPPPPHPRAIIPDDRPLGTFENQDSRDGKTQYI